jgi:hypothetical protein
MLLLLFAQIAGPFQVVRQGGNVYLVPQGIIKTGPRSFSMADPKNPYRQQPSRIPQCPASPPAVKRTYPNLSPTGGVTIIINPFVQDPNLR